MPDRSGPSAVIRIFGVTREVVLQEWGLIIFLVFARLSRVSKMKESSWSAKVPESVRCIELVQKQSIMYYQQQTAHPFLKIVVSLPSMVPTCRGILERGIQIEGLGMKSFMTYESNILFPLRLMIDCNVVGGNWIEVACGMYRRTARKPLPRIFEPILKNARNFFKPVMRDRYLFLLLRIMAS